MTALDPGQDLFPLLAAILASTACALLGNFLVLRRLSLMGDAISHSVLPGLVIAFLLTTSRNPLAMFVGAAIAGVATVVLVELVKKLGRVESGAAMGVVFSILFALGVLLIERAAVRHVDLDADCVLHGQLELLAWFGAPATWGGVFSAVTLEAMPRQVTTLLATNAVAFLVVGLLFKELRLAAFDGALATTLGFNASFLHLVLMVLVAAATVAAFEAVGSILVIAMLICPAVTARMLTDRLPTQLLASVAIAILSAVVGYVAASSVPGWFGRDAVNAAGSITVVSGAMLVVAILLAPRHGVVASVLRRRAIGARIALDDVLATLYRAGERNQPVLTVDALAAALPHARWRPALASAARDRLVRRDPDGVRLTTDGAIRAADLVRRHRLWESYLVDEAGFAPDHVHEAAERLEHVPVRPKSGPRLDPHGRQIPPE